MEDPEERFLAHNDRNQTILYHLSLFAQQAKTCLIIFLQDNVQTANSNRLFCLLEGFFGLAYNVFI